MDLLGCAFLLLVVHLYGLSGGSAGELARDVLRSTASIPRVERGESAVMYDPRNIGYSLE